MWDRSGSRPQLLDRRTVRDVIAENVAAFANADGGTLLVGIEDDGSPTGHAYAEEAVDEFALVGSRRLRPPVNVEFARVPLDDVEVLVFSVPMAPEAVMVVGNGFPTRVVDTVVREPQEVINARKQAYRQVGWEQRVRPEATLDDLDLDLARSILRGAATGERSVQEQLIRYGLAHHAAPSGLQLTNGALLLFARASTLRWHPRAGVRLFRVDGTERSHGTSRNVTQIARLDLPVSSLITQTRAALQAQIPRSEKLHDLFFRELPEYPELAWQEALVNAVAHRDYADQTREVEVWLYDNRMEVSSPGDLVAPVTLDALRSRRPVHASRNPLIVRVLVDVGLMREEGEGVPRMYEEMQASFLRPPQFELEDGTFTVTFLNEPVFEGPTPEWASVVDGLSLTDAQRRILLARPDSFTNEDYRQLNDVDRDRAYREIQQLVDRGVVSPPSRTGPGATYHISPDLYSTRAWLEARLPKLRVFLTDHEFVKNADYRDLFGVSRYTAVRELQRLVEEGFLELVGERRGSRYLAGPSMRGLPPRAQCPASMARLRTESMIDAARIAQNQAGISAERMRSSCSRRATRRSTWRRSLRMRSTSTREAGSPCMGRTVARRSWPVLRYHRSR